MFIKIKPLYSIAYIIIGLLLFVLFQGCNEPVSKRPLNKLPNIIFILTDDIGYGDLSCYGHPYSLTPNLDDLANGGIRFSRFYVAGTTCSPSRTAFMTGRHPMSFEKNTSRHGLGESPTITQKLKDIGYVTAHVGKWHIGQREEVYSGIYGIDSVYLTGPDKEDDLGKDAMTFKRAVNFIKNNYEVPFYLNIWTRSCHAPIVAKKSHTEKFDELSVDENKFNWWYRQNKIDKLKRANIDLNESMGYYLAELFNLDKNIGILLQTLEDLGIDQNTLIVFSSDQGPAPIEVIEDHPTIYKMLGYSGDLRGEKHSFFEGGVRVPLIINWPGKIHPNQVDGRSVVSSLDYFPSLCSMLGIDIKDLSLDGFDKSKVFLGSPEDREGALFWQKRNKTQASVLYEDWKLHLFKRNRIELYKLENDPSEQHDISEQHQDKVDSLLFLIQEWQRSFARVKNSIK